MQKKKGIIPSMLQKKRAQKIFSALQKLFPYTETMLNYSTPWELLVAVQLSAQCTDKKVNEVTQKLFKEYPKFKDYLHASANRRTIKEFERAIFQTGFYRNKTKNILSAARVVHEVFYNVIPRTLDEMLTIPGVGRKTAHVVLGNVYGSIEGIAVDTHVKRLARVLQLSSHKNPDMIEQDLMQLFPKKNWFRLTNLLIAYGRKYCSARSHDHTHCPLIRYT